MTNRIQLEWIGKLSSGVNVKNKTNYISYAIYNHIHTE